MHAPTSIQPQQREKRTQATGARPIAIRPPRAFYRKKVKRPDVRSILDKLAKTNGVTITK